MEHDEDYSEDLQNLVREIREILPIPSLQQCGSAGATSVSVPSSVRAESELDPLVLSHEAPSIEPLPCAETMARRDDSPLELSPSAAHFHPQGTDTAPLLASDAF